MVSDRTSGRLNFASSAAVMGIYYGINRRIHETESFPLLMRLKKYSLGSHNPALPGNVGEQIAGL